MKRKFIIDKKEYETEISTEAYEMFLEIRDKVNMDEYGIKDIKFMKEALATVYNYQFSVDQLNKIPIENLIFEFFSIDIAIAKAIESKIEKLNLNFNQDK